MSDDPKVPRKPDHLPEGGVPPESDDEAGSAAPFDSGDQVTPEDAARWRRPNRRPGQVEERFPMLPQEVPPTAPLKDPPRKRPAPAPPASGNRNVTRNLITLFFVLASCSLIVYFVIIWQNPYSVLNPLAPPTPLPQVITATYTPTDTLTPAPTPTPLPSLTPTAIASVAPTATFTPVFLQGISTVEVTPSPTEDTSHYAFGLKPNHVVYLTNPDSRGGCKWSSIGGTVMNFDGTALNGYGVHVFGNGVDQTVGTGSATGMGPGGFEVQLGTTATDAEYSAQLIDPQGNNVSPVYEVDTKSDCTLNIAILRFVATAQVS